MQHCLMSGETFCHLQLLFRQAGIEKRGYSSNSSYGVCNQNKYVYRPLFAAIREPQLSQDRERET